jgi:outer membrane lipoprotein SlyB
MKTDPSRRRLALPCFVLPGLLALAGCNQGYSPNTYASSAAQQEAAVQRGMIVGVRQVLISANGTIGAAAGGAAGGVAGAQAAGGPVVTALGAIGGTLVGGIGGTAAAHAVADTKGWEYIVQEDPGDKLVSVTQTSKTALPLGLHVLVIAGAQQARIVPDYTVQIGSAAPAAPAKPAAPSAPATFEVNISPVLPASGTAPSQTTPVTVASDPATPPAPSSNPGGTVTAEAVAASAQAAPVTPSPASPSAAPSP